MRRNIIIIFGAVVITFVIFVAVYAQQSYLRSDSLNVKGQIYVGSSAAFDGEVKIGGDQGLVIRGALSSSCPNAGDELLARRIEGNTCTGTGGTTGSGTQNNQPPIETLSFCEPISCSVTGGRWQTSDKPLPSCEYKNVQVATDANGSPSCTTSTCYAKILKVLCVGD
jgi:hypothetical protein